MDMGDDSEASEDLDAESALGDEDDGDEEEFGGDEDDRSDFGADA